MLHRIQEYIESTRGQDILYPLGAYLTLLPYMIIAMAVLAVIIYALYKCIQIVWRRSREEFEREERKKRGPPRYSGPGDGGPCEGGR